LLFFYTLHYVKDLFASVWSPEAGLVMPDSRRRTRTKGGNEKHCCTAHHGSRI